VHGRAQRCRPARTGQCPGRSGAGEAAIERPDGPVIDVLLDAGITVAVISPNQVKNLRGRYGSAGNKDDRFDAFVLADTLRTDRARLAPLTPDSPATVSLRRACRARKDLVRHRARSLTSSARTCTMPSPAPPRCSLRSTRRSAWPSWPASIPRTAPAGSPLPGRADGWPASATPTRPSCMPAWPPRPAASRGTTPPPRPHHAGAACRAGHPHQPD
jgi:transposase